MKCKCTLCDKSIINEKYYLDIKEGILKFCSEECQNQYMKFKF